jgi:hypothetical protein
MKVEPFMKNKDDEILKMEVFVLRKLQKSKHACKFYMAGREKSYSFLIMSLLVSISLLVLLPFLLLGKRVERTTPSLS